MSLWCLQTPLCSASLVQLSPDYISHNLIIKQVLLVVIRNNKCVWLCVLMIVHELACLFYMTDASAKQAAPAKVGTTIKTTLTRAAFPKSIMGLSGS